MTFIFHDTETTDLDPAFDQILQFAAIRTDDELNVIDTLDVRHRLLPHMIPSPRALLVTGVDLGKVLTNPCLQLEIMRQTSRKLAEWSVGGASSSTEINVPSSWP